MLVGQIDTMGHPHSAGLRVEARFHRADIGHMEIQVTFNDPKAHRAPLSVTATAGVVA
jgi:hypothetical protein